MTGSARVHYHCHCHYYDRVWTWRPTLGFEKLKKKRSDSVAKPNLVLKMKRRQVDRECLSSKMSSQDREASSEVS